MEVTDGSYVSGLETVLQYVTVKLVAVQSRNSVWY